MNPDNIPPDLRKAFTAMQQQVEAAHHEWIEALIRHRPELAARLRALHNTYGYRNEQLEALLLLLVTDPSVPVEGMYREYSAILDGEATRYEGQKRAAEPTDYRQRGAQTKRDRTHGRLVEAAVRLILGRRTNGGNFATELAQESGISPASTRNHFRTKDNLLRTAYARLLEPVLNPESKRS